ncbi:MAG: MYG1 family protein [Parcubacteria group bacterium]
MSASNIDKKKILIVTHNASFHTDDIFAVATLTILLEKDHDISVIRTRDVDIINSGDYVVDVGGIHDPSIKRFDHHQEGGAGKRENDIPYAAFGLVWKAYGKELCVSEEVANRVDEVLVQPIDGPDNGVQIIDKKINELMPVDIQFLTHIFGPTWKEDQTKMDDIFLSLVPFAKVLINRVIKFSSDEVEGENKVKEAYEHAQDRRLVVVDNSGYPWLRVLSKFPEPLYVVYKNPNSETWSVKGIRENHLSFLNRKPLPQNWAGKKDFELEKITGVPGAVFCHNARFMAVNKTKEGILKMAEIALNS